MPGQFPKRSTYNLRVIDDIKDAPAVVKGRICGLYGTSEATCLNFLTNETYAAGTAPLDSDNDGMPNSYESANGLNPNSSADGAAIISGGPNNGYSNLEVYLNQIVGGPPPVEEECGCTPCPCPPCWARWRSVLIATPSAPPRRRPPVMSSFGTPKAALALGSMAVTSGETGNNIRFSVGATDGTAQNTISVGDIGGGATDSVAARRFMTDQALSSSPKPGPWTANIVRYPVPSRTMRSPIRPAIP